MECDSYPSSITSSHRSHSRQIQTWANHIPHSDRHSRGRGFRRPKLMQSRPSYASMCMSLPSASRSTPSIPKMSPKQSLHTPVSSSSSSSASYVPVHTHSSPFRAIASHVRSWVHAGKATKNSPQAAAVTAGGTDVLSATTVVVHQHHYTTRPRSSTTSSLFSAGENKMYLASISPTSTRPSSPLRTDALAPPHHRAGGRRQVSKAVF